ncbi:mycofactocin precursor MftA [Streptomyces sp. NBC_00287]|nr:mycofactocin precursor MftA [Streptomyces sp. NBC_00287]
MNELHSAPSDETGIEAEAHQSAATASLIEAEDLLEEISIDGMCGVY